MLDEVVEKSKYQLFLEHVVANPAIYALSIVLVLVLAILGLAYSASQHSKDVRIMTDYAHAIAEQKPEDQLAKLEARAGKAGRWNAEITYVIGETAIAVEEYVRAKQAFAQVIAEYSNSEFVPRAVDGLGFLAENAGNFQEALGKYQEVLSKWPNTLMGKRENLNIGRVQESLGNFADAKAAYEAQLTAFPDSLAAEDAQKGLDALKASHPDLFPAPPAEAAAPPAENAGDASSSTTPAAATETTPAVTTETTPALAVQ